MIELTPQRALQYYAHRIWVTANAFKPPGSQTFAAAGITLENRWKEASQFFKANKFQPAHCGISILKNLHASFTIPWELEADINLNLFSCITPKSFQFLCGDETSPGGSHACPFLKYESQKPNPVSLWYQTVATPTSIPKSEFCLRIRSFRVNTQMGIKDPPQGMTEEMVMLLTELGGGLLGVDSLYSTQATVEQMSRYSQIEPENSYITSLHTGWWKKLGDKVPSHMCKVEGQWATLIRPVLQQKKKNSQKVMNQRKREEDQKRMNPPPGKQKRQQRKSGIRN